MYSNFRNRWRWTIAILFTFFVTLALGEEKSERLTPMDVFHLQYGADPQISPDGKRIVYARGSSAT